MKPPCTCGDTKDRKCPTHGRRATIKSTVGKRTSEGYTPTDKDEKVEVRGD